ncbi:MAG: H/ACA RNA-protein complex protein Gar1 [Candidatus Brockarchaeota archaeon]|nr:H/ACA RNA-protein complex protein Gar1 [Candidatus Brockarchaeota archaeon]MBO3809126.1 H/ACA RNA-protein complex protein Gar1 [Candidatus Brockarchaeota archaeon]MBO3841120.1 H/ACA RNA-protein complex protein Gar1 [Candidatus Brockarchaeota archaeon]
MKRKGTVENILNNRIALVRLDGLVGLGSLVLSREMRPIGSVTDIIGPVKEPYAVVVLKRNAKKVGKGEVVFFKPRKA